MLPLAGVAGHCVLPRSPLLCPKSMGPAAGRHGRRSAHLVCHLVEPGCQAVAIAVLHKPFYPANCARRWWHQSQTPPARGCCIQRPEHPPKIVWSVMWTRSSSSTQSLCWAPTHMLWGIGRAACQPAAQTCGQVSRAWASAVIQRLEQHMLHHNSAFCIAWPELDVLCMHACCTTAEVDKLSC